MWCTTDEFFFFENHPVHAMLKNSICHKFCKWMDIALRHTIVRCMDVCFGEEENNRRSPSTLWHRHIFSNTGYQYGYDDENPFTA